tara:strand:+ start:129 stop:275 length:147 start_codon:yes stop_codon:yes gene_type:complete
MVINNEIFDTYRIKESKIKESIIFLKENDYVVIKKDKFNEIIKTITNE